MSCVFSRAPTVYYRFHSPYIGTIYACVLCILCAAFFYMSKHWLRRKKKKIFADIPYFKHNPNANNLNTQFFQSYLRAQLSFFFLDKEYLAKHFISLKSKETQFIDKLFKFVMCVWHFQYCEESREFHLGRLDIT